MAEQIPPGFDDTDFEASDFQTEAGDPPFEADAETAATALLVLRRRRR